jgi:murein DD-endopeptidase MepM/ murein hydrolase activator NlpD
LCPTRAAVDRRFTGFALLVLALLVAWPPGAAAQGLTIDLRSRAAQPGEVLLVTVTTPPGVEALSISAFSAKWGAFKVGDSTWRALLGIDLDQRPGTYTLTVSTAGTPTVTARRDITVLAGHFRRRVLTVAPDYVNPPPELLARITTEAEFMRSAYEHSDPEPAWRGGFTRPVPEPANSSFGTRSVFNGEARSPHAGTDFLSPAGTPVRAPASGRVVGARDLFFTGNTVVIDHGLGVFSMLAHLSRIDVHEGQVISAGEVVGLVGATGRVTGPHLHWALRIGSARVDALSALATFGTGR